MLDRKIYHLYLPPGSKILVFGLLTVFTVVGIVFFLGIFPVFRTGAPPRLFGLIWLLMVAWNWYYVLSIPHSISVANTGEIAFQSLLGQKSMMSAEIESIVPQGSHFGFLIVRTARGKIRLLNQFDGFHEFISRLKELNPSVGLRGC